MAPEENSQEKRKEILERMKNRRGDARRTGEEIPQSGLEADTYMDTFQRLRNMKATAAQGGPDLATQVKQLDANDPLLATLMKMRETRKKGGEDAEKDPMLQAIMGRRRKKTEGKKEATINALSPDSMKGMQQNFSATSTADLTSSSVEELQLRKQNAQYRHDWLSGLLEETKREIKAIESHLSS